MILSEERAVGSVINILERLLATIYALLFGTRAYYVWPLSNSTAPDEMNSSFGPRINRDKWDFHDGIDLPAPIGSR
jgi:murein DD-endopeptidase MepM/ murein hydrolase activator NlpD